MITRHAPDGVCKSITCIKKRLARCLLELSCEPGAQKKNAEFFVSRAETYSSTMSISSTKTVLRQSFASLPVKGLNCGSKLTYPRTGDREVVFLYELLNVSALKKRPKGENSSGVLFSCRFFRHYIVRIWFANPLPCFKLACISRSNPYTRLQMYRSLRDPPCR